MFHCLIRHKGKDFIRIAAHMVFVSKEAGHNNFAKFILSWRIEPYVSGKVRMETIRQAYHDYGSGSWTIDLILDGGPENNNDQMNWRIEPYVSGKVRMETIRQAYHIYGSDSWIIDLILDGPENNND